MKSASRETQKEMFLNAYATLGVISKAAEVCGINRANIYRWQKSDPEFKERMSETFQTFAEDLESKMFDLLEEQHRRRDYKSNPYLLMHALKAALPEKYGNKPMPANDHAQELLREFRQAMKEEQDKEE